ncbi:hypothetical protein JCM24511_00204 [Saitozyma sp. JCM 24511]|nr:hypothetical protein JCM24511_00204 [Saitozyma sp. JCM 24511]
MSSNPASRALTPSSSKIDLFTLHRSMAPSRSGAGAGERAPLLTQNGEGSVRRNYTMELDASGVTDTSNAGVSGLTGMSGVSGVSGGALASEEGGKDTPRDRERADDRKALAKKRSSTAAVAKKIRQRSKYYVPVTEWLPNYSWSLFSGDVVAGISAMSYANGLARLTPVAGLWSTAIPALIYGALGTCRRVPQLSLGPEAALSLLIGQMIQETVYADPHNLPKHPELEAAAIALVTTFQIGIITTALGLLRLGFLDVVLSRALLRGFITAVGIIIFIEQLVPMLGLAAVLSSPQASHDPPTTPIPKLLFIFEHLEHVNETTAILSFSSLAVLIVARVIKQWAVQRPGGRWVRFVPEILIVVVGTTALTGVFKWDERGVDILGKISGGAGLPFGLPLDKRRMKYFNYTFPTAFVSAVVGIVDSVVAARENGSKYGYAVSPNRELVALGTANLGASLMAATGAVPVFGSITRSRLNGQTGGRTQMAAIITSITIILSIFFLLPYLYFLPKMTGTFILTLLFSIETGLVASVVFSLILVVQKSTQTRIKIIGRLPNTEDWVPIDEDEAAQEELPGVLVVRIRENLNFANTGQLKERLRRLELYGMQKSHPSDAPSRESAKAIILHMGDVSHFDSLPTQPESSLLSSTRLTRRMSTSPHRTTLTARLVLITGPRAIQILAELTRSYVERGVGLHFAHLRPTHSDVFRLVGITDLLGPNHFHRDLRDAMREIESLGYGNSVVSRYT